MYIITLADAPIAGPFDSWKLAAGRLDTIRRTTPDARIKLIGAGAIKVAA